MTSSRRTFPVPHRANDFAVSTGSSARVWSMLAPAPLTTNPPPRTISQRTPEILSHGASGSSGCSCTNTSFGHLSRPDTYATVSYTHLRAHETDSYLVCR